MKFLLTRAKLVVQEGIVITYVMNYYKGSTVTIMTDKISLVLFVTFFKGNLMTPSDKRLRHYFYLTRTYSRKRKCFVLPYKSKSKTHDVRICYD